MKAPPKGEKGEPSVVVDGQRVPKLGKGAQWGSSEQITRENVKAPKPPGSGLIPWGIFDDRDTWGLGPEQNRAMRTLRRLPGGSAISGLAPFESLGFKVPKPKARARIEGEIHTGIRPENLEYAKLERAMRLNVEGVARETVKLSRVQSLNETFDLYSARNRIHDGAELLPRPIMVRHNGQLYVVKGGEAVAAARLLGRFDLEAVVVDLDRMYPKPATRSETIVAFPDKLSNAERRTAARRAIRAWYESDGVRSKDTSEFASGTDKLSFKRLPKGIGGYHFWTGDIQHVTAYRKEIEDAIAAAKRMERGLPSQPGKPASVRYEHYGFKSLLHEEAHGCSPGMRGSYLVSGRGVEEATTELYARRKFREFFGYHQPSYRSSTFNPSADSTATMGERIAHRPVYEGGKWVDRSMSSYKKYIEAIYDVTHRFTGLDPSLVGEAVDLASIRMRQGSAVAMTPNELITMYVDALIGVQVGGKTVKLTPERRRAMIREIDNDTRFH